MRKLNELSDALAERRRSLRLQQQVIAAQTGITPESLSRFERGRSAEFRARKLLAALAVLGIKVDFLAIEQPVKVGAIQPGVVSIGVSNSMVST